MTDLRKKAEEIVKKAVEEQRITLEAGGYGGSNSLILQHLTIEVLPRLLTEALTQTRLEAIEECEKSIEEKCEKECVAVCDMQSCSDLAENIRKLGEGKL